ncbi:hypothetical protein B446_35508 (plasmid) [Streptomyces collinus Tu 365]|uniref:Uncharacterized protein n=1 Tax=Streptomyces collinus (strain DSM 40733 / Tue 365) TaxID=1214242 RepID=S5W0R0_STRC3|nr:hypothetical protein B446_35508 [Streptomyces collinus Tu 365]
MRCVGTHQDAREIGALGGHMNESAGSNPFHPAQWKGRKKDDGKAEWPPPGLPANRRAWLVWFADALARGGFTSLGQTSREVITTDGKGREIPRRQLHVVESTMSRWLDGKHLPGPRLFQTVMECLNERIEERRRIGGNVPDRLTGAELAEGLRLLEAARVARDAAMLPAQCDVEQRERDLAEASARLEEMRGLRDRLAGQLEEARSSVERLQQRIAEVETASEALRDDYDAAVRRVRQLEERLAGVHAALEGWQARYEGLRAEYETARAAARQERMAMQDELCDLRAAVWLTGQDLQEAEAARHEAETAWDKLSVDANSLREELRTTRQREDQKAADRLQKIDEAVLRLKTEPYPERFLRTIRDTWDRDDIYLLALRLGEEEKGPSPRRLTNMVGVHYYDPSDGKPGILRRFIADLYHIRLEPRARLPRKRPVNAEDGGTNPFALGDGTQI